MRNQRPKTFVTPGVLAFNQYGTTGRYGNGGGGNGYPFPPNPWPSGQQTVLSEPWGEYATGEPSVVAASRWTFNAVTTASITNGVTHITVPGAGTNFSFNAKTADQVFNAAKGYSLSFGMSVSLNATGSGSLWMFAEDDGTGTVGLGCILQSDNLDGNYNVQMRAANNNVGALTIVSTPGFGLVNLRLAIAANKQMTLFNGATQIAQASPVFTTPTGSKKIWLQYGQSAAGNTTTTIEPITFKAFKT